MRKSLICIFCIAVFAAGSSHVIAEIGEKNSMTSACQSSKNELKRLCEIVNDYFKTEQDEYIHLGGEFYLVAASDTGRVSQGLYAVNINTGQLKMFGGYGYPTIGEISKLNNGILVIKQSQMSMWQGNYWEVESELQVRTNPLTGTPYIIKQVVSELVDKNDGLGSFCANPSHANHPDCKDRSMWRKKKLTQIGLITSEDLIRAHNKALSVYKKNKRISNAPFKILEDAGVRTIIENKPSDMSLQKYVNILNDYAFFAYRYGEGRIELSIEILDKVIKLSPDRRPAYLNMAEALEYLTKYTSIPLGIGVVKKIKKTANKFKIKYQAMK